MLSSAYIKATESELTLAKLALDTTIAGNTEERESKNTVMQH